MQGIWLVLFAIAAGFTTSGVVASLYSCSGMRAETHSGKVVATAVLILAGPSVIFRMAVNGLREKEWKLLDGWLVVAGLASWSLAIGLLVLDIVTGI